ncbi:hypothetical protein KJK32_37900 [Streptomyces sp. JCM17656]|nr:hypothetical protein KJK32_37900 [Streptomyces sp. JCM17656]
MRLTDLLHPHLDTVTTVVDATGGGMRLEPYLHLPPGVDLRDDDERPVTEGELALLSYGPHAGPHGGEDALRAVLARMRPGARGLIVFGHGGSELPYHRLLDDLVGHRCQVLRAAPSTTSICMRARSSPAPTNSCHRTTSSAGPSPPTATPPRCGSPTSTSSPTSPPGPCAPG